MNIGERLGPYEVIGPLGEGGMGVVYRARDTKLQREVALKILPDLFAGDAKRLARFTREAQLLAAVNHSHIAQIYGIEDSTSVTAIVMELVDGETLAERIAKGPLALDQALAIARQIADALDAAHERGIVHRDLKPANVKLTAHGEVKVLDFGLAKLADPAATAPGAAAARAGLTHSPTITTPALMTGAGMVLGTAAYMAPEQARGQAVDKRADIWAFGVVLYEMLTGRLLFEGETVTDTLAAVLTREPDWMRVPAGVRPLLRRCLQKDPRQRLRDIGDAAALVDATREPAVRPATIGRGGWLPWAVATTLALALAVVALAPWRSRPPLQAVKRFQIPRVSVPPGPPFVEFAASPDGRYIAYFGNERGGRSLRIHALDSLEEQIVPGTTTQGGRPIYPFWSPDSKFVAFALDNKLKKVSVSGGPPQTICDVPTNTTFAERGVPTASSFLVERPAC